MHPMIVHLKHASHSLLSLSNKVIASCLLRSSFRVRILHTPVLTLQLAFGSAIKKFVLHSFEFFVEILHHPPEENADALQDETKSLDQGNDLLEEESTCCHNHSILQDAR